MKPNYEKETLEEVLTETESFIFENPCKLFKSSMCANKTENAAINRKPFKFLK